MQNTALDSINFFFKTIKMIYKKTLVSYLPKYTDKWESSNAVVSRVPLMTS